MQWRDGGAKANPQMPLVDAWDTNPQLRCRRSANTPHYNRYNFAMEKYSTIPVTSTNVATKGLEA